MPTLLIRLRLSASMDSDALSKGKYCIKITTGTSSSNDRTLAAKITFASGSDSIVVADGADYAKGSTVLEQCYSEALADVRIQLPMRGLNRLNHQQMAAILMPQLFAT